MTSLVYPVGQLALGEIPFYPAVVNYQLADVADIARKKKHQEIEFEKDRERHENIRGSIYDAIHPTEEYPSIEIDASQYIPKKSIYISPNDEIVHSLRFNSEQEKHRKLLQMMKDDEDDIELLLRGY